MSCLPCRSVMSSINATVIASREPFPYASPAAGAYSLALSLSQSLRQKCAVASLSPRCP